MSRASRPHSLVRRLILNLAITIGLLLGTLVLSLIISTLVANSQRDIDAKRTSLKEGSSDLLRAMLDQETGVRAYITNQNTTFLEPFNSGRVQYSETLNDLQTKTSNPDFTNTSTTLREVARRANAWYNEWAEPQIARIQQGQLEQARSNEVSQEGKSQFDIFRASIADLSQAIDQDIARLQQGVDTFRFALLSVVILLGLIALMFIWRTLSAFVFGLRSQLTGLMEVTDRLEEGDLTARIENPSGDELGRLGQNFNNMATALQQQQAILRERDIQNIVSQINTTLSESLELESLLKQFLRDLLELLDIKTGAIYLYDRETNLLTLAATQGIDQTKVAPSFQMGEGLLGLAAETRQPNAIENNHNSNPETQAFALKTMLGHVLPATVYNQPLVRGSELFGILVATTIQTMPESTRNIINIISSGLSAAISNAKAYRHIQSQAEELERRRSELEHGNQQLSRQRDELTVLNQALEEANHLRNQFLSTMSHELRTPLTAIIGFSQLSLRSAEASHLSSRQKSNLEHILRNGQHLLNLVNDVLDIAKIEAGRVDLSKTQVKLDELLKELVEGTQSLWLPKKIKVSYKIDPQVTLLETDYDKLRQVLLNLLSNAIKFTEKGQVTISAGLRVAPLAHADSQEEQVAIVVSDTGVGIAPEVQELIFDEFYQADSSTTRKYGGTGLGLSIVRKLTDLLGGQIELESIEGQGSTFTVILPRRSQFRAYNQPEIKPAIKLPDTISVVKPEEGDSTENNPENLEIAEGKRLVLAVDDDPDILTLLRGTLEDSAYQIIGLVDPQRALEIARKLHPYAITLDVMMPELNGWQILQQLKSDPATADIPIVMLSVVSDRSAGYVLGASDYLVKPMEPEVLLQTLDRLTQQRTPALQNVAGAKREASNGYYSAEEQRKSKGPASTGYILVVDDDPDVRMILEDTIREAGYQVKTAAGGREGLRLVHEEQPALVLLDLMMPDLDGFEVLDRLKSDPLTLSIPVVIQTAKSLTPQERERLKRGAIRIIQKGSVPLERLMDELSSTLKR